MKKWTILAPLGLAAAGAAALVLLKKKPEAKAAPAKGGPAKKPAPVKAPANLKTGSYSFISGFQNASTVEMTLDYDADRFSFAVVEENFLSIPATPMWPFWRARTSACSWSTPPSIPERTLPPTAPLWPRSTRTLPRCATAAWTR